MQSEYIWSFLRIFVPNGMNDLSKNFQTGQRFTRRVHQIEGSVKYQSQTTAYTCVSLIAGVHVVEVFMGRVTRSAKAVISGVVSALCCSDSLFLTISNVTEVTASSLRQLFLSLGGLWLNLTVFSLSLSSGFANTASYTHYVFQATTPVSIPSMPSEPPHSEDRISVSWQSPPVIYKGLPVRWLLLSFLFSSSQRRIRERLSPCLKVDSVSLVGSRLSLPACLSLSLGVFQKLHLHDFWFPVSDAFAKQRK